MNDHHNIPGLVWQFHKKVKARPILLVFDGHMTQPAHCTNVMQPFDVSCFSSLKSKYEQLLTEFVHHTGGRQQLSKAAFCNVISTIWHQGLTKENMSGFSNTGNFPVDSSKYKVSRLDKVKL